MMDWPCGLIEIDGDGRIMTMNARMRVWLGLDDDARNTNLQDILPRAVRIYYETHLRPLLTVAGKVDEISIDFQRPDRVRFKTFVNAVAEVADGEVGRVRMAVFRHDARTSFEEELIARRREGDVFKTLVASSPQAIISVDDHMVIQTWNPAAEDLFGYRADAAIGQPIDALLLSPDTHAPFAASLARAMTGEIVREETTRIHRDGQFIAVEASKAAVHDELGHVTGAVITYTDIMDRKAAEEEARNLVLELNHRAKNVLSIVQVIARQTGRHHDGPAFHTALSQRLASLISNQDSLIHNDGRNANLKQLARAQFAHLIAPDTPALTIEGPDLLLKREAAQAIGMALFELATNAVKYGSLSTLSGRVTLRWAVGPGTDPSLDMVWQESGGPAVTAPTRQGFGSQVTGPILESVTGGQTTRQFDTGGFRWTYTAPIGRLS